MVKLSIKKYLLQYLEWVKTSSVPEYLLLHIVWMSILLGCFVVSVVSYGTIPLLLVVLTVFKLSVSKIIKWLQN